MAQIKVHGGDFIKGKGRFDFGIFTLNTPSHRVFGENISNKELASVSIATEESIKKLSGTLGWGLAGGLLLGGIGAIAGLLCGGNKKEVTFIAEFKDGRKLLATADSKIYKKIQAAAL